MRLWRRALPGVERRQDTAKGLAGEGGGYNFLWTFARGGERSKSGVGVSTLRSGSLATTAPLAAAAVAAAPTLAALLVSGSSDQGCEGREKIPHAKIVQGGESHLVVSEFDRFIYLFSSSVCLLCFSLARGVLGGWLCCFLAFTSYSPVRRGCVCLGFYVCDLDFGFYTASI